MNSPALSIMLSTRKTRVREEIKKVLIFFFKNQSECILPDTNFRTKRNLNTRIWHDNIKYSSLPVNFFLIFIRAS